MFYEIHFDLTKFISKKFPSARFKGSASDSGGSKSTTTSYMPAQAEGVKTALEAYLPKIGQGENIYPDQRVAGLTPLQQQAFTGSQNLLANMPTNIAENPLYQQSSDVVGKMLGGQYGAQPITPEQTDAYFRNTIQNPAQYQFQTNTAPGIREEFAGPGYWGSARAGAVAKAGSEMQNWLGTQKAGLDWNTLMNNQQLQESQANRIAGAVPLATGLATLPSQAASQNLANYQQGFGLGSAEQQQRQVELDTAMQKFAEQNRITNPEDLAVIMGLLGMNYTTGGTKQWGPSGLNQWLFPLG